ncbi:single-stranded DNA-binding protein [Streptomyces sp. URMC 123]|uniref:single-stranded DNA-binding protein n=1 Tax=Streptomyces sp. URMC 123 TaxID=3423403 RepID=UPI003F1AF3F5
MNDTVLTVVGNAATRVECWEGSDGAAVAKFRLATTARWWDRQSQAWTEGRTSFYTVWARRSLAVNLAASVAVGEPLMVHGRLRVRDEERGGQRWVSAEIDAVAVGHDLARGTAVFRRVSAAKPGPAAEGVAADASMPAVPPAEPSGPPGAPDAPSAVPDATSAAPSAKREPAEADALVAAPF